MAHGQLRPCSLLLKDAGLDPEDIEYINAHGTSTRVNDKIETLAIQKAFGYRNIPVSSNKSMIGHTLGAAGAIEAAATVLAVHHGILPPTINFEEKDPECDLDVIPNQARTVKIGAAISNSFGFGGQKGCLFSQKPEVSFLPFLPAVVQKPDDRTVFGRSDHN